MSEQVPELRFSEFTGGWKISTLDEVSSLTSGGTPSRTKPDYWGGQIPWITTSEIGQPIIREATETISDEGLANSSAKLFKPNTLLIAMYGQGKTRGQVSILGIEAATNQACAAIRAKKVISPIFLFYYLFGKYGRLRDLSNDGSQKNLSLSLLKRFNVPVTELAEQQKIASFLTAVDEKISKLQRKLEYLQTYKRGVMQKLFSQEVRFKREDGSSFPDWEEKKMGDLFSFKVGGDIGKLNFSKTFDETFRYPIFANGEGEGLYGYADDFQYKPPAVTVTGRGTLGNAVLRKQNFNAIVRLIVIQINEHFDGKFIEAAINNLNIFVESTGVPQLTAPQLSSYKLSYPTLPEQQKIATFLSALDSKIDAVNGQISLTETFKKGLLQQMFV